MNLKDKQKELAKIVTEIEGCSECKRNKIGEAVPGEGNADADIVFIGEAPGKTEAETGRPFVGRAGKLLRELIKEAGLKDDEVYITSPVKRLPKYTTPTPSDVEHGCVHLYKQLKVIDPKIVVLLGRVAVLAILRKDVSISKYHGKMIEKDGRKFLICYHPAAPLYSPKVRIELEEDFKKLKKMLK